MSKVNKGGAESRGDTVHYEGRESGRSFLKRDVDPRDARIAELEAELADAREKIEEGEKKQEQLNRSLARQIDENGRLEAENRKLREELEALQGDILVDAPNI